MEENIASIHYGRRYIIESPDAILDKYQMAKEKGANNVILDRLYNEYLTAKHGNDPQWLRVELLKSEVEPYLHMSPEMVNAIFGAVETSKKVKFTEWWKTLDDKAKEKTAEQLKSDYAVWFTSQEQPQPQVTEEPE